MFHHVPKVHIHKLYIYNTYIIYNPQAMCSRLNPFPTAGPTIPFLAAPSHIMNAATAFAVAGGQRFSRTPPRWHQECCWRMDAWAFPPPVSVWELKLSISQLSCSFPRESPQGIGTITAKNGVRFLHHCRWWVFIWGVNLGVNLGHMGWPIKNM